MYFKFSLARIQFRVQNRNKKVHASAAEQKLLQIYPFVTFLSEHLQNWQHTKIRITHVMQEKKKYSRNEIIFVNKCLTLLTPTWNKQIAILIQAGKIRWILNCRRSVKRQKSTPFFLPIMDWNFHLKKHYLHDQTTLARSFHGSIKQNM